MSANSRARVSIPQGVIQIVLVCQSLLSPAIGAEGSAPKESLQAIPPEVGRGNHAPRVDTPRPRPGYWAAGVGGGLRNGARQMAFVMGPGFGTHALGSKQRHDLAMTAIQYSRVMSDLIGEDRWYRGNAELVYEAFGGTRESPDRRTVVGVLPMLRYSFATGSRWVPFVNGGVGGAYTDIRHPDLSGGLQFTVQVGAGGHYFLSEERALTLQYRWFHLSNAGIRSPNSGLNTHLFFAGMSWLF
jgi:lipid A 3-O-deacylase